MEFDYNNIEFNYGNIFVLGNHTKNEIGTIDIYCSHFNNKMKTKLLIQKIIEIIDQSLLISNNLYNSDKFTVKAYASGVTFKNIDISFFQKLSILLQEKYPEKLHKCYIIHPPQIFLNAWNLIKKILDKNTRNKIFIIEKTKPVNNFYL